MRATTLLGAAAVAALILLSPFTAAAEEGTDASDAPLRAADHLGTERHALVIGIDDYADRGIPDLTAPENGARAFGALLADPEVGGMPDANVRLLLGAEATAANIRAALARLVTVPKEATVLVYFAGHGGVDGDEAFWVAQDSKAADLAGTAIANAELKRLLARIAADRILVIVDGVYAPALGGKGTASPDHEALRARYQGDRHAVLVGAAAEEHTVGEKDAKRSVLTRYLLTGLSGKSDADDNGVISASELTSFVQRRLAAETYERPGLERLLVDLKCACEPSRFLIALEPEVFLELLGEDASAPALRQARLQALAAVRGEDRITEEQARLGLHLLGVVAAGLEASELEQRVLFIDLVDGRLDSKHLAGALAAIRRADRRTLVVPDDFSTIQAAIDAAAAGDTVFVKAGEYDEHIVFKNGITLRGEGREQTVVRMVPGKPENLLVQDCAWGVIEGLQFDGSGGTAIDKWSPDGIHLNRSSVRLRACISHSSLGCGLYAEGAGCRPYVQDCTFERNAQDGACFSGMEEGRIVDCICRSNAAVGIRVRPTRGLVTIRTCLCEFNEHAGIGVSGGSRATLVGNDCQRNQGHGILAWEKGTSVTLEDNTCTRNKICGIYLVQRAAAVVNGGTCARNGESGCVITGAGTRAEITGLRSQDHEVAGQGYRGGIVFADGAEGEVTSCTCQGNVAGIRVKDHGTSVRLRDNVCARNQTSGVEFADAGPGHASGNRCEENDHGISVSNTEATLEGNTLRGNKTHGIYVVKRAAATATGNQCESNVDAGIHVTGVGTKADLRKNTCTSNGTDGIQFALGAGGTADENECRDNKGFGIGAYTSGTRPTFRKNRCTNNGKAGIGKEGGATPVIESSNVQSGNGR